MAKDTRQSYPAAPSDLQTPEGRDAWVAACRTLEHDGRDPFALVEPLARYARAADLAAKLRAAWVAEGAPTTTLGGVTGRLTVEHPILRSISAAERDADRFWTALVYPPRRGQVGRPRGAASSPGRAAPPPMRVFQGGKG